MRALITCADCQQQKTHFAKGLCVDCYQYQRRTGQLRGGDRRPTVHSRYCRICLMLYTPRENSNGGHCSAECAGIGMHMRTYGETRRGSLTDCARCGQVRTIRTDRMCNPCYVTVRYRQRKGGLT